MHILRIDSRSPYRALVGVGGIGSGCFFALEGNHTLGRNESRPGHSLDVRDYCKLHIIIHYVAKLLAAGRDERGFRVLPIGLVGDDAAGRQVVQEMADAGIDTSMVATLAGKPTLFSVCFQYPDGSGGNITTSNSAAALLRESDVDAAATLLGSGRKQLMVLAAPEVPLGVRRYLLELATRAGAFRLASFVSAEIQDAQRCGMLGLLDLVSLNESEAGELIGETFSPEKAEGFLENCQQFLRGSWPNLRMVVSAGAGGAYAVTREMWNYRPAPKVQAVSTAGAGDALLGGIIAAMATGVPLLKAGGPARELPSAELETALDLGVLLASYKCQSPHTIHPDACLRTLIDFARSRELSFAPGLQSYFASLPENQ